MWPLTNWWRWKLAVVAEKEKEEVEDEDEVEQICVLALLPEFAQQSGNT